MSNIIELRQYTLKPGRRDELIALFEREFVETQEAEGIDLIGTFRDADNPDRFVWLRGFPDMERRAASLAAFYGGAVWKAHRNAANDTMIDSDNVLLFKPAWDGAGFAKARGAAPFGRLERGVMIASLVHFEAPVAPASAAAFRAQRDAARLAVYVTEESPNTFPALPVRSGEHVCVVFTQSLDGVPVPAPVLSQKATAVETLRLIPTARSRINV